MDDVLDAIEREELIALLGRVVSARERWVVERRYGLDGDEPQTWPQIGAELGVTRERARQLHGQALIRMRGALGLDP